MRNNVLSIILFAVFSSGMYTAEAKTTRVNSLVALQETINQAVAGDNIILENGVYSAEAQLVVRNQGTEENPITIAAAKIGGTEIKGMSGFLISKSAAHIILSGFKFTHQAGTTKIDAGASFCRITRNVFECTGKGAYLTVSGDDNQIDHNTFQNKATEGQMISVQGPGSSEMAQRNWIRHNYFTNFTPTSNNCSSIQVGLSGRSLSHSHTLVEYNLFVNTRGENENICNKSCDNIYRFNTFGEGSSELSLRHGNRCQVYANFFIGSEGIRFYGHQHKIYSNYFERCNPAINIGNGDGIVPRDKLTSHDRPDSIALVFNTLYNNTRNIIMQGRQNGLGATCIVVANNIIQGGNEAFKIDGAIVDPVWTGNMIWETKGGGNIPEQGYIQADPGLKQEKPGTYHLQKGSPAIGKATGTYPFVTTDINGQVTEGSLNIGADQLTKNKAINHILTLEEVGPQAKN